MKTETLKLHETNNIKHPTVQHKHQHGHRKAFPKATKMHVIFSQSSQLSGCCKQRFHFTFSCTAEARDVSARMYHRNNAGQAQALNLNSLIHSLATKPSRLQTAMPTQLEAESDRVAMFVITVSTLKRDRHSYSYLRIFYFLLSKFFGVISL